jgi:hypothetical protein
MIGSARCRDAEPQHATADIAELKEYRGHNHSTNKPPDAIDVACNQCQRQSNGRNKNKNFEAQSEHQPDKKDGHRKDKHNQDSFRYNHRRLLTRFISLRSILMYQFTTSICWFLTQLIPNFGQKDGLFALATLSTRSAPTRFTRGDFYVEMTYAFYHLIF